ncbi:hypothetical protein PTSG_06062 [Salpingoeca rosetta]|uniref:Uncharacterized protein n=1 Tax=Salpingoeca rosetta (strain ATCC 50818 / BSB-021) TaxID=946362 RepID=F2UDK6_SALR5|nr:uncharacterized protein PTSG_06062 [Salpingoeca rosetta]EGD74701.1 hypothetical protein PTSG_06062 [Salpingoeca rosetta]|eukprot:XP_004992958.1 hypothetical protein PTSG_06062 [Salpingoeca rosetta]
MSFFQRVASWLANEAITGSLARSKTFQRFAQVSHQHVQNISSQGVRAAEKLKSSEAARNLSSEANQKFGQVRTFSQSFLRNIKEVCAYA